MNCYILYRFYIVFVVMRALHVMGKLLCLHDGRETCNTESLTVLCIKIEILLVLVYNSCEFMSSI